MGGSPTWGTRVIGILFEVGCTLASPFSSAWNVTQAQTLE